MKNRFSVSGQHKHNMPDNGFYRAFEDAHRGSRELIHGRLRQYLPFIQPLHAMYPACEALDLGCGRGEWLEVAGAAGFSARGVDIDEGMLAACVERGLHVTNQDAIAALQACGDESLCIVSAFHVAEHISFSALQTLVNDALRTLKPGGLLVLETPNPENLVVGTANFYLDPTHQRPLPPLLLLFLTEHAGFSRSKIVRLQESPELAHAHDLRLMEVLEGASPDYAVVAQKEAAPENLAAFDAVFQTEFGLTLGALSDRYENALRERFSAFAQKIEQISFQSGRAEHLASEAHDRENALRADFQDAAERMRADLSALQHTLLERERGFAEQLLAVQRQSQEHLATAQQSHAAREARLQEELAAQGERLEALRAQAQVREAQLRQEGQAQQQAAEDAAERMRADLSALQHTLLERERGFTEQLLAVQRQSQEHLATAQQFHAAREARLQKEAHAQIKIMREEHAQYAAYAQALAGRIAALQATWWWRLSMLWRHPSNWPAIPCPVLPQSRPDTPPREPALTAASPQTTQAMPADPPAPTNTEFALPK